MQAKNCFALYALISMMKRALNGLKIY